MKAVVAAFNQEKALVGAFSVITNLRMDLFEALLVTGHRFAIIYRSGLRSLSLRAVWHRANERNANLL